MSHSPDSPKSKRHHYAGGLLAGLGLVANVTAVAGLFTSHANVVIIAASVLAVIVGLYLLLKRWGMPVGWNTLLAVAIIVAGSAALSLALRTQITTSPDNTSHRSNTNDSPVIATPTKKSEDKGTFYQLRANESLNLDATPPSILPQQASAESPADLYLSDWGYLAGTSKNFYPYQPPRQSSGNSANDERDSCKNLIAVSQKGVSSLTKYAVEPGKQYCAKTNLGAIMLLTIQELIDKGTDSSVSFYVKLWPAE